MLNRIARLFAGSDIFISYRWRDRNKEYGLRLTEELEKRGLACYIDEKGLSRGEFVTSSLERAVRRSRMFVVLVTEDIEESTWVPQEIGIASRRGRKIVPVNVDGVMNKLVFDDPRWLPLRDRSRVEESLAALESRNPSAHVVRQIDEAYQFTRQRTVAMRILFATGAVFFGLSVLAAVSAVGAVRIRNTAEHQISVLRGESGRLAADNAKATKDKAEAERQAREAGIARDGAKLEEQQAKAEASYQRILAADQLRLKGYVAASSAGDKTAAFLNVRNFEADDRTNGWKDAAVAVLQNPIPVWQADEQVMDLNAGLRRIVVLTDVKTLLVRELDRPGKPIRLGGDGPVLADGVEPGVIRIGWSADGNFVRIFLARRLGVWDIRHPEKPLLVVDHGFDAAFSPEGNELAVVAGRGVAFWKLAAGTAVRDGEQELKGNVWGFSWIKGRKGPYCQVRSDGGIGQSGLFEVWPSGQKKLQEGRLLQDYELTGRGELITKEEHFGQHPSTDYAIRENPEAEEAAFRMTVPAVDIRLNFGLTLAGRNDRFLVVSAGKSLWVADRTRKGEAPIAIVTDMEERSNNQQIRALSNDRLAVSSAGGKKVRVFDLAHPANPKVLDGGLGDISPDGRWCVNSEGILDLEQERDFALPGYEPRQQDKVERVVFSPDSKFAIVTLRRSLNNNLRLLIVDLQHPMRLETVDQPGREPLVGWTNAEQKEFLTQEAGMTRLWRLSAEPQHKVGEKIYQFPTTVSASGDLVWMEDGGYGHWNLESWLASGERETSIPLTVLPDSLAVNAQKSKAVAPVEDLSEGLGSGRGMRFLAWSLKGSAPVTPVRTPDRSFEFVSASRGSLRVLTISKNDGPEVWAEPFDKPVARIPAKGDFFKGYLSNAGHAAALFELGGSNADSIDVWDLSDLNHPSKASHYDVRRVDNETFQVAVTDDGKRVATFGAGNSYLFSKEHRDGQRLNGSENGVRDLQFSPSGKRLVATLYSGDAVIWLCDRPDRPELVMSDFSSLVGLTRFGESDDEVVTVTRAGDVRLWDISAKGLRAELNRRPPLCMTPTEIRLYLGLSPGSAVANSCNTPAKATATGAQAQR